MSAPLTIPRPRLCAGALLLLGLAVPATAAAQEAFRRGRASAASATPTPTPTSLRDPIFVEVEGGASYVALLSVRGGRSVFPNMVTYTGWGPGFGVTAGLHALVFSVALQVHASFFGGDGTVLNPTAESGAATSGTFHTIATTLEGALRLPMGRLEVTLRVGVGHMFMGGFTSGAGTSEASVSADGWIVRTGLGFDVRVYGRWFVGLDTDVAVSNVRRAGIAGTDCPGTDPLCAELQQDGDAVALMVHPHLQVGLHF